MSDTVGWMLTKNNNWVQPLKEHVIQANEYSYTLL